MLPGVVDEHPVGIALGNELLPAVKFRVVRPILIARTKTGRPRE